MKPLTLFAIFLYSTITASAQTNTVHLRDGNGTNISGHQTVTDAYAAIPNTITHAYKIELDSAYNPYGETYPIILTEKNGSSATNTITICASTGTPTSAFVSSDSTKPVIIFDGADWVIIDGVYNPGNMGMYAYYDNNITDSKLPVIQFINGACHNRLENISLGGAAISDPTIDPLIEFGTSINNSNGNSDNVIQYCSFWDNTYGIHSKGTPSHPNNNNQVISNQFYNIAGIIANEGTGKMLIKHNYIDATIMDTTVIAGITLNDVSDTISIINNNIVMFMPSNTSTNAMEGIRIVKGHTNNNYVLIANNEISNAAGNNIIRDDTIIVSTDSIPALYGIHLINNEHLNAGIYFNTIFIDGHAKITAPGKVASAAIFKSGPAPMSHIDIKNNILVSNRVGTNANTHHVALGITDTSGDITLDYNIYNAVNGNYVFYNGKTYNTIKAYRKAIGAGQEMNTNSNPIKFVAGMILSADMMNIPWIKGTNIPSVFYDYENDLRAYPYRGADEIAIHCNGTPTKGKISGGSQTTMCSADSIYVSLGYSYTYRTNFGGHSYQWQHKPLNSNQPFSDIPGATTLSYLTKMKGSTVYRMRDSCIQGGAAQYSDLDTVIYKPKPVIDSISAKNNGHTYFFTAIGAKDVTDYKWHFGDGDSSTLSQPIHTYKQDKKYSVWLMVSNDCGNTYYNYNTDQSTGVSQLEKGDITIYPDPVTNNTFTIKANDAQLKATYYLYNMTGHLMASDVIPTNNVVHLANTLPTGTYIIKLQTAEGAYYVQQINIIN